MTSPRRRQSRPIESVSLKISFRMDRATSRKVKEAFPSAVLRAGGCEVRIDGDQPGEVAEKAKALLEALRKAVAGGEGLARMNAKRL